MDQDARLIICAMTPACVAVNKNGWMKSELAIEVSLCAVCEVCGEQKVVRQDVSPPDKNKLTLVRVPSGASKERLDQIKEFFLACVRRLPGGRLPKIK
jgi:hypothetical protein